MSERWGRKREEFVGPLRDYRALREELEFDERLLPASLEARVRTAKRGDDPGELADALADTKRFMVEEFSRRTERQ